MKNLLVMLALLLTTSVWALDKEESWYTSHYGKALKRERGGSNVESCYYKVAYMVIKVTFKNKRSVSVIMHFSTRYPVKDAIFLAYRKKLTGISEGWRNTDDGVYETVDEKGRTVQAIQMDRDFMFLYDKAPL